MQHHGCPIQPDLYRADLDKQATNCPCRGYYSVEQVREWMDWCKLNWRGNSPSDVSNKTIGIAAYFAKKGVEG